MDPLKRTRLLTVALLLLVFLLGSVTGGFVSRAVQQRRLREAMAGDPATMRTRLMTFALERRLDLTSRQRDATQQLLRSQEGAFRAAVEPCRPAKQELTRQVAEELRPMLTPEQHRELDDFLEQEKHR